MTTPLPDGLPIPADTDLCSVSYKTMRTISGAICHAADTARRNFELTPGLFEYMADYLTTIAKAMAEDSNLHPDDASEFKLWYDALRNWEIPTVRSTSDAASLACLAPRTPTHSWLVRPWRIRRRDSGSAVPVTRRKLRHGDSATRPGRP